MRFRPGDVVRVRPHVKHHAGKEAVVAEVLPGVGSLPAVLGIHWPGTTGAIGFDVDEVELVGRPVRVGDVLRYRSHAWSARGPNEGRRVTGLTPEGDGVFWGRTLERIHGWDRLCDLEHLDGTPLATINGRRLEQMARSCFGMHRSGLAALSYATGLLMADLYALGVEAWPLWRTDPEVIAMVELVADHRIGGRVSNGRLGRAYVRAWRRDDGGFRTMWMKRALDARAWRKR